MKGIAPSSPSKLPRHHRATRLAGLASHPPRNGEPGWITMGRGYERLREAARVAGLLDAT
jgi:hypothetical protein